MPKWRRPNWPHKVMIRNAIDIWKYWAEKYNPTIHPAKINLTTIGDIRETFAYFVMAFVAAIFLVLQMISLTVCVNFYVKFYSIILWKIFLRCEKIKQSIFKTTYRIMVFLHALDIAQLFTWSFAIFMGVSGFYYEPYTELVLIFCSN